jgi:curved DNA-binding protein CbpA
MDFQRCCDVLDLTPPVSLTDLKEAYKDLVQVWHPDRFTHNPRLRHRAEEKIKLINLAYETLEQFLLDQQARQIARSGTSSAYSTANPSGHPTANPRRHRSSTPAGTQNSGDKTAPFAWNVASAYHDAIDRNVRRGVGWAWFDELSLENKARVYGILVFPVMLLGLWLLLLLATVMAMYPMMVMVIVGTIGFYWVLRKLSDASTR